jgi:DNA-directed RNA polymerase III subunit RPC2
MIGNPVAQSSSKTKRFQSLSSLLFSSLSQLYLKHNSLGDEVPMMVVLKAMGMESDQETVQLIGTEDDILDILSPTLEEPYSMGIYTQEQVHLSPLLSLRGRRH